MYTHVYTYIYIYIYIYICTNNTWYSIVYSLRIYVWVARAFTVGNEKLSFIVCFLAVIMLCPFRLFKKEKCPKRCAVDICFDWPHDNCKDVFERNPPLLRSPHKVPACMLKMSHWRSRSQPEGPSDCFATQTRTHNLPTKTIPTKIHLLKISGKILMGMRIPPLKLKIMLESNPLKSTTLVRRLAVIWKAWMTCCHWFRGDSSICRAARGMSWLNLLRSPSSHESKIRIAIWLQVHQLCVQNKTLIA